MMYEELAERLRYCAKEQNGCGICALSSDCVLRVGLLTQAAYAIEKFIEVIQNHDFLESLIKPCWIPVTEQLPEKDGEYLTRFRVDDSEPSFGIFPFDANVPAFGYWDECYDPVTYGWAGSDFIEVKGVTHWMPLPEPPKEEDDNV